MINKEKLNKVYWNVFAKQILLIEWIWHLLMVKKCVNNGLMIMLKLLVGHS